MRGPLPLTGLRAFAEVGRRGSVKEAAAALGVRATEDALQSVDGQRRSRGWVGGLWGGSDFLRRFPAHLLRSPARPDLQARDAGINATVSRERQARTEIAAAWDPKGSY